MLRWFRIEGQSPEALDNVMKSLQKQKLMTRRRNGNLFACISTAHQKWLTRVCGDFNAVARALEQGPEGTPTPAKEIYTAPCGEEFYDYLLHNNHIRYCKKCIKIKRTSEEKAEKVTPQIEPGMDFNFDGVLASVEATRDKLYAQIELIDELAKSLRAYKETKSQVDGLVKEAAARKEAVKLLVRDGKL